MFDIFKKKASRGQSIIIPEHTREQIVRGSVDPYAVVYGDKTNKKIVIDFQRTNAKIVFDPKAGLDLAEAIKTATYEYYLG